MMNRFDFQKCDIVITQHRFAVRTADEIEEKVYRVLECLDCGLLMIRDADTEILITKGSESRRRAYENL